MGQRAEPIPEVRLYRSNVFLPGGARIAAEQPIVVGQFMKGDSDAFPFGGGIGDPSLSLVIPTDRFRCGGPLFSFPGFLNVAGNGSYVNIVAPTGALGGILLDTFTLVSGVTCGGYSPIDFGGGSGYSWTKCLLANPTGVGTQHRIDSGSIPIGVYVYGQQQFDGSYAYVGGMSF